MAERPEREELLDRIVATALEHAEATRKLAASPDSLDAMIEANQTELNLLLAVRAYNATLEAGGVTR